MEEITGIKETCLYIRDLEGARKFYHERLEFPVIHYDPGKHIFFKVGRSVLLCFNPDDSREKESPPPHYAEGNQHLAFEVPETAYQKIYNDFKFKQIEIIATLTWKSGQESFYFLDPENNVLEIVPEGVWD
jgi:catechol 2,3-dioxygenase-like lactoylglutathione lyase family enzyme